MCTTEIQIQIEELKPITVFNIRPAPPLLFGFYFRRLLTESNRIAATYRRDQEACGDDVLPC